MVRHADAINSLPRVYELLERLANASFMRMKGEEYKLPPDMLGRKETLLAFQGRSVRVEAKLKVPR